MPHHVRSLPRWALVLAIAIAGVLLSAAAAWFGQPPVPRFVDDEAESSPVMLERFLASTRGATGGPLFAVQNLDNQPGRVFSYTLANIDAATADDCEVRWTSIDRRRNLPVAEGDWRYDDVLGWPDGLLIGAAVDDAGTLTGDIWTPLPGRAANVDRYFVRLRLLCAGREQDTHVFPTSRSLDDDRDARGFAATPIPVR